jgi:hypothetical protein
MSSPELLLQLKYQYLSQLKEFNFFKQEVLKEKMSLATERRVLDINLSKILLQIDKNEKEVTKLVKLIMIIEKRN